jgi:GAF domain-containing protein
MPYQLSVSHAMTRAAREIDARRDLATTLHTIVDVARRSIPGIDHVGITLIHRKGRLETVAATGQLVRSFDDFQCALDEGPCVDAIRRDRVVVVEHARREQRWPRYIPAAVRGGLRAQLGLRLSVDAGETLGSLNLYSTRADTIAPEARALAQLFARHVAVVLKHVVLEQTLSSAFQSQALIGTAVEIVMARYALDNEQAFAYLARVSQHSDHPLNDVARQVLEGPLDTSPVSARDRVPKATLHDGRRR